MRTEDPAKAEELWNPMLKAWFPDGLETHGLALVKVHAETAVTGKTPDAGENETVRL